MIQTLQSLRGIFVFMIFLSHFKINSNPAFGPGGDIGVTFFFMLSGLVLRKRYRNQKINKPSFLMSRLSKIMPIHVICLAYACLIGWCGVKLMILDLLLLQSWVPDNQVNFSLNGVAWYLSTLLFLYFLFPLGNRVLDISKRKLYVIVFLTLLIFYILAIPIVREDVANYWLYVFPPARIFDMGIGMLLADLTDCLNLKLQKSGFQKKKYAVSVSNIALLLPMSVLIMAIAGLGYAPFSYGLGVWWWVPTGLILTCFAIFKDVKGFVNRIFGFFPLVWFGNISLSFFLTHALVIRTVDIVDHHFRLGLPWPVIMITVLLITTIVSALSEKYIVDKIRFHQR